MDGLETLGCVIHHPLASSTYNSSRGSRRNLYNFWRVMVGPFDWFPVTRTFNIPSRGLTNPVVVAQRIIANYEKLSFIQFFSPVCLD